MEGLGLGVAHMDGTREAHTARVKFTVLSKATRLCPLPRPRSLHSAFMAGGAEVGTVGKGRERNVL